MCYSANSGGIVGNKDMGSTFMWAKLNGNRVPKDYTVNGLKQTAFKASNDLYGSFCRVRVTLQSDDKKIQDAIKGKSWNTAYFAVGDSFTCGSWIPDDELEDLANAAAGKATEGMAADQKRLRTWTTILGALGGSLGGYELGESIRKGKALTGLTKWNTTKMQSKKDLQESCVRIVNALTNDDAKQLYDHSGDLYNTASELLGNTTDMTTLNTAREALWNAYIKCLNDKTNNPCVAESELAKAKSEVRLVAGRIKNACNSADIKDSDDGKSPWWTVASTIALGTGGALLVNKATRDIQNSELSAAEKAAYEEWMNSVGRHVSCYIGADEAGNYGDVITTSLE